MGNVRETMKSLKSKSILETTIIINLLALSCRVDAQDPVFVSNLDRNCLRCLCFAATDCNEAFGCVKGYCGPYKISRLFWIDAEKVTLPEDDPERAGAYEDCSLNYWCAQRIITNYLAKFAKDCNKDGVTDCEDHSMVNFNGGYGCETPLDKSEAGRNWTKRFRVCSPQ